MKWRKGIRHEVNVLRIVPDFPETKNIGSAIIHGLFIHEMEANPDRNKTKERLTELYFSETKQFNASCIELFQKLDEKATFFTGIGIGISISLVGGVVYAFTNGYYVLCTAAILLLGLLVYALHLLTSIVRPMDISRQGDLPDSLRETLSGQETYINGLLRMIDSYNDEIQKNRQSNELKAKRLKTALTLLVFVPYMFLLAYIALKAPSVLEAVHSFVAAQQAEQ